MSDILEFYEEPGAYCPERRDDIVSYIFDEMGPGAAEAPQTLGDLRMMQGVRKFPQRVKCAMLAWRAVEQALEQGAGEATISTEPD